MRILSTLWILLLSASLQAASLSVKLEDKGYYFSSLNALLQETNQREVTSEDQELLERLISRIGTEVIRDYDAGVLNKFRIPAVRFVLAEKSFAGKEYSKALELLGEIQEEDFYWAEAKYLEARTQNALKKPRQEFDAYTVCYQGASGRQKSKDKEERLYFRNLAEVCLANRARVLYEGGNYKRALQEYEKIPKDTYRWPYLLLERAWANFQLGDFNRALGLLVTYKSPLLETYFLPEAEYLSALIYYDLCLFKDSTSIIDHYDTYYRPKFTDLEKVLVSHKASSNYFFNLMFRDKDVEKKHGRFVADLLTRMMKESGLILSARTLTELGKEARTIKKKETRGTQKLLLPHLRGINKNLVASLNGQIREEIFRFLQSVTFFSQELFKLNLEMTSKTKDLIYENKQFAPTRSRGDLSNVKRNRFQYFWTFDRAFWADELGDYSFALQSSCQTVKRKEKK